MMECYGSDHPTIPCAGEVVEYWSRSGATKAPRCEAHWFEHNRILDEVAQRYPDSDVAPAWFDPTYAGERWNYDD